MTFPSKVAYLLIVGVTLPVVVFAGQSAPCLKAVSSENGDFLVTSQLESFGVTGRRMTFEIFPRSALINNGDVLSAASWDDRLQWSVVLESQKGSPVGVCPLLLITDNGEYLVVLNQYAIEFAAPALRIYRRERHSPDLTTRVDDSGVLVKDIYVAEIWPPGHLPRLVSDGTPQWFADGTFEFSPDNQSLIHKTRWGNTVRINLSDGSVGSE